MRWMTYSSTLSCRPDRLLVPKSLSQKERFCSVTLALDLLALLVSSEAMLSERDALAAPPRFPARSARPPYSTFVGGSRGSYSRTAEKRSSRKLGLRIEWSYG